MIFDMVGLGAGDGGKMVGWGHWGGIPDMGMGLQTRGGFLTWGCGSRHGDGVPDMGVG